MINAQRRPIIPRIRGLSWSWVAICSLVILGFAAVFESGVALYSWIFLEKSGGVGRGDLASTFREFAGFAVAGVAVFLLAFGLGAFAVSRIAKRPMTAESIISAFAVHGLLAFAGSALSRDAYIVSIIMVIPSAVIAGLGARIGELIGGRNEL